ncbi:MAG: hypothetical protein J6J17_02310 [Bacilli bacterium]|nr:hypothetical protein [Bacilli bacterium]
MMQVEIDLENAIKFIKGKQIDIKHYKPVQIYSDYSLKHFKNYKLENRNVLTRLGSYHEVADLASYNANVTCYSANRFDIYFLNLFITSFNLLYEDHFNYFIKNYKNYTQTFSYKIYELFRGKLSDHTRFFFDELYKKFNGLEMLNSGIISDTKYSYEIFLKTVRHFLSGKYSIEKMNKITYINIEEDDLLNKLINEETKFNFINLSYNLDKINSREFVNICNSLEHFSKILSEHGKVQVFTTKDADIILPEFKRIQTRSIDDTETNKNDCKKEYAYMYTKENNIDK